MWNLLLVVREHGWGCIQVIHTFHRENDLRTPVRMHSIASVGPSACLRTVLPHVLHPPLSFTVA